jgi:hypothetical protein
MKQKSNTNKFVLFKLSANGIVRLDLGQHMRQNREVLTSGMNQEPSSAILDPPCLYESLQWIGSGENALNSL